MDSQQNYERRFQQISQWTHNTDTTHLYSMHTYG